MKFDETFIKDLYVITPNIFGDERGWFSETYNQKEFIKNGINLNFVQDNHSYSLQKGVLRGLHFQTEPFAQTKLVRCTKGRVWDVAVDLRKSSPTYLKWCGIELSEKNHIMFLIPRGFAHGFITLEENSEFQYKVDNFYDKSSDRSIKYNDPVINVIWPNINVILSEKDMNALFLQESDVDFQ